jgi:hypothetical protein
MSVLKENARINKLIIQITVAYEPVYNMVVNLVSVHSYILIFCKIKLSKIWFSITLNTRANETHYQKH